MATGFTGVPIRFAIATANRFVNHRTNTVGIGGFFYTINRRQRLFAARSRQNDRYTEGGKKGDYFFHLKVFLNCIMKLNRVGI